MRKDTGIHSYILGLLFGLLVIPILDNLTSVVFTWFEVLKIKPTTLINDWNDEIERKADENRVVGFQCNKKDE